MIQTVACGTMDNKTRTAKYEKIDGLNHAISAQLELSTVKVENEVTLENETPEATGNETTEERDIVKDTNVQSAESKESAVVGVLKKGDIVQIIELVEGGEWYKVVYKGRVAYVATDAVKTDETVEENTDSNSNSRNTNSGNNRNANTNGNSNNRNNGTNNTINNNSANTPNGGDDGTTGNNTDENDSEEEEFPPDLEPDTTPEPVPKPEPTPEPVPNPEPTPEPSPDDMVIDENTYGEAENWK